MKLNFWQWIGIVLLVIGAIFLTRDWWQGKDRPTSEPQQQKSPATQPAP